MIQIAPINPMITRAAWPSMTMLTERPSFLTWMRLDLLVGSRLLCMLRSSNITPRYQNRFITTVSLENSEIRVLQFMEKYVGFLGELNLARSRRLHYILHVETKLVG